MNRKFDDITLSSYVDGELDSELMGEVEAFVESDADARRYVVNAVKTTARLRESLNKVLYEEVPENLIHTILPRQKKESRLSTVFHPAFRIAAAIVLVLGVLVGSALWWLLLSGGVSFFRARFNARSVLWVNRVSGVIIVGFGVFALLRI